MRSCLFYFAFFLWFSLAGKANKEEKVSFNYPEPTSIVTITKDITKILSKNIVYTGDLKGQVTILSQGLTSKLLAKDLYIAALKQLNLSLIETKSIAKIVPTKKVSLISHFTENSQLRTNDQTIVTVLPLDSIDVSDIYPFLNTALRTVGKVQKINNKSLILSGSSAYIKQLINLVRQLDEKKKGKLRTLALKYYSADDALKILTKLGQVNSWKSKDKVITAPHNNALLIYSSPAYYHKIKKIIRSLDKKPKDTTKKSHFYVRALEFAQAEDMSKLIMGLKTNTQQSRAISKFFPKSASLVEAEYNITPDKGTNSLIISSSNIDYQAINRLIRKLDKKPAQIFFDINILEISRGFQYSFSTNGLGFFNKKSGETSSIVGWNAQEVFPLARTDDIPINEKLKSLEKDLTFGIIKKDGIKLGSLTNIKTAALIKMMKDDNHARVISAPFLLTNSGEEASVTLGSTIPYSVKTTHSNKEGSYQAVRIKKENLDLSLILFPQSKGSKEISLNISLDISSILGLSSQGFPLTTKQKLKQNFLLQHGQTLFMAGFSHNKEYQTSQKIPILGDIPLLGKFFQNRKSKLEEKKVIFFITPYVCHSPEDIMAISKSKANEESKNPFINKQNS